jgi:hypothetical protein
MKPKIFFPALAVFLALIGALMFIRLPGHGPGGNKPLPPMPSMKDRFNDTLPFTENKPLSTPAFAIGTVKGAPAWKDTKTGLVWSATLENPRFLTLLENDVRAAAAACADLAPSGVWTLPTAEEFDAARANGLIKADQDARHHWVTYMAGTRTSAPAGRVWDTTAGPRVYRVRCVGKSR